MDRPFLRSSMPQPSNSPTISHIPGRRYTVAGSLFVAGQNEEGAEDESDYQRNDDVGLIHNSESDQYVSKAIFNKYFLESAPMFFNAV